MGRTKELGRVQRRQQESPRRCTGEAGAAVVEMTIVGIILCFLLLGIIAYGFLMGFRQNMVQAAAEGARRGAVAQSGTASAEALAGATDAVAAFGQNCNAGGMTCTAVVAGCTNKASAQCVTVHVKYDYKNHPILPDFPFMEGFLPENIETQSVAEINP
jgi:Flp pilus assembly protein TadG